MKAKLIELMDGTAVSDPTEYLILGVDTWIYYALDKSNYVGMYAKRQMEITDETKPAFWIEKKGRMLPEEWFLEDFFNLHDTDIYDEWAEIWFITQFAKGLSKFNLPSVPLNFKAAYDKDYKVQLIVNYLEMACSYDNLIDGDVEGNYSFGQFNDELTCFRWENGVPHSFSRKLMSEKTTGFEILRDILEAIGETFKNHKISINDHWLDKIRNRILYSIWALFGTKDFDVYKLIYTKGSHSDYIIKYEKETYLLSFDYSYG